MIKEIITMVLMLVVVIGSVGLGYVARDEIGSIIRDMRSNNITAPEQCRNLTMEETAYCLNSYVRQIWKYKERPDKENPSLEELKEEGGDCLNWAELYVEHIENLGFNAKMPLIDTENNTRHTFAIISDETGYCILDQMSVKCYGLRNSSLINEQTNNN